MLDGQTPPGELKQRERDQDTHETPVTDEELSVPGGVERKAVDRINVRLVELLACSRKGCVWIFKMAQSRRRRSPSIKYFLKNASRAFWTNEHLFPRSSSARERS